MKKFLLLLSLLTFSAFADFGVARVWHLTHETKTEKCAITVVKLTSGKYKVETLCFKK